MVAVGDVAPTFGGRDQHGAPVTFGSRVFPPPPDAARAVLLVFFPWAFSSTCGSEMRGLRDSLDVFSQHSVDVIGVSCDAMFSQRVWADAEALAFPLVSDHWPHGNIARLYGVFDETTGVALRASFLVDRDGIVRWSILRGIGEQRSASEHLAALALLP